MAVDDDLEILELLKAQMEAHGCELLEIADSREAAHRLLDEKFDGLIVDVKMPHVDGFMLTHMARMSKLNSRVPIVMLTGMDNAETMRKGFAAGANFFLGKPFTRERIYNLFKATRGPMSREKHRYARLPYRTPVTFTLPTSSQALCRTFSADISEGGMRLLPCQELEVDQHVSLAFAIPGGSRTANLRVKVVRKVPPDEVGVNFLELAERDRNELQSYAQACLKEEAEMKRHR